MLKNAHKFTKTFKNSHKPSKTMSKKQRKGVHEWFHLKKQTQLTSYCVLRDAYRENAFEKTKPILSRVFSFHPRTGLTLRAIPAAVLFGQPWKDEKCIDHKNHHENHKAPGESANQGGNGGY